MTVKLNIHDWPKRGSFMRNEVDVEAKDEAEAIRLGILAGQQKWPHGKIRAYDVVKPRLMAETALQTTLDPLTPKRGPGRPRKDAA